MAWQPGVLRDPTARRPRRVAGRRSRIDARRLRFENLDARILLDASGVAHHIVTIDTSLGSFQIELLDDQTPLTVANFLNYVQGNDYNNTFIHRIALSGSTPFAVQGGGYAFSNDSAPHIPTDPPVVNEFSTSRPNLRGTIAMAKTSDPNSATSEWFVNTSDNAFLDDTANSGGFTVFGRVLGDGMQVVDAIAALPRVNAGGAFATLPVLHASPTFPDDLVVVNSVSAVTGSVHGTLYADQDGNGQRGAGEVGLGNWTVFVDNNNNGVRDSGEQSTTTDAGGNYTLSNVQFGAFTIRAEIQPGWVATIPAAAFRSIDLTSNQNPTGQDFGFVLPAPGAPDLHTDFDTGASNSDNITKLTALRFVVSGVATGATVNLFDGTTLIGSAAATGSTVTINTTGTALSDGLHGIYATQTLQGATSGTSSSLEVRVDATPRVIDAIANQALNVGDTLTLNVQSTEEGDGGSVYSFLAHPTGMTIDPATGAISFTPTDQQVGHQAVTVQAVDLAGNVSTIMFDVAVNGRPLLPPIENKTVNRGTLLSFIITASDVDMLDFELLPVTGQPFPTGATITSTGETTARFDWTPDAGLGAGTFSITVHVSDPGGLDAFQTFQITVNAPPVLNDIDDQTVDELVPLSFSAVANDADAVTYTLVPVAGEPFPNGATIDATTGLFHWTPSETQGPEVYRVTVRATDTGGLTDERTVQITVGEVNTPPVLAEIGDFVVSRGDTLSFTAAVTDGDVPANTFTFSLDPGAPDGASVNSDSGVFTWTPSAAQSAGNYSITLRVSDGTAEHARTFQVTVNDPPELENIGDQSVDELALLSFSASADDQDAVTYSLEPVAGQAFPAGATIDAATGQFQWTPTEAQGPGVYHITVRATDSHGLSDTRSLAIAVGEVEQPPILAPIENQTVNQGGTVTVQAEATDDDLPTPALLYSLAPGAPGGATINPTSGQFTWNVADAQSAGTFSVTILVSDNGGQTFAASQTFDIEVNASTIGFALFQAFPLNGAVTSAAPLGNALAVRDAALAALAGGAFFPGLNTTSGFQQLSDVNSNNGRLQSGINNSQIGPDTGVQHAVEELLKEMGDQNGDVKQTSGEEGKGDEVKPAVNLEPPGPNSQGDGAKKDGTPDGAAQNGEVGSASADAGNQGERRIRVSRGRNGQVYRPTGDASQDKPAEQGQPSPDSQGAIQNHEAIPSRRAMQIQRAVLARRAAANEQGAMLTRRAATGEHAVNDSENGHEHAVTKAAFFMPLLVSQLPKETEAKQASKRKQRS